VTRPAPRGWHRCPCGCDGNVPNRVFACRAGWARLPGDLQAAVRRTATRSIIDPERADIVLAAIEFYRAEP
jgi:hypothetical protein